MGSISKQKSTESRPKYTPIPTKADSVLQFVGIFLIILIWVSAFSFYFRLPEIISVHFNLYGEMDRMGSKNHLILIPIIATFLFVLMTILLRYPESYNYPVKITAENAQKQYQRAIRLIRWLNFSLGLIFNSVLWMMFVSAQSTSNIWNLLFIPAVILLSIIPLIFYLSSSKQR